MSIASDGCYTRKSNTSRTSTGSDESDSPTEAFLEESFPLEDVFRGFEKIPKVELERERLTSYKNTGGVDLGSPRKAFSEKSFTFEEVFRGFEKIPKVELERQTISSYINNVYIKSHGREDLEPEKDNSVHIPRLLCKCSVKLVNHDLNKLLIWYNNRSDSDSDTMGDEGMLVHCNICNKLYSSLKKLQSHQKNKHMIIKTKKKHKRVSFSDRIVVHEVKEYHRCRKCTKIYEDYKSLKIHMRNTHKKRKCYICNYCSKKFVDRMFFKVHIKLHCDICSALFPNRSDYQEHRRTVCRTVRKYSCKTCNDSFFKFMDLKDHSYNHRSHLFICDVCKDQFDKKCALSHHIAFLHSNHRPTSLFGMRKIGTERLYLCNFCDESAVEKENIEAHVQSLPDLANRAMTGYKDYYFCDQCLKKFDTEKNMLQHKWSHFLKTSDYSQIRNSYSNKKLGYGFKKYYNVNEKLPEWFQPRIVLEKIKLGGKVLKEKVDFVDVKTFDITNGNIKKAVVHPVSKKTLLSRHQCPNCNKYYSTNYCLNRHIVTMHSDYQNLQCKVCEEVFVWPSLLQSHKCIRLNNIPEMPFDDARPEIHFDNIHALGPNGFDDFNITDDENDYMHSVDFDIPEPIVEIRELDPVTDGVNCQVLNVGSVVGSQKVILPVQGPSNLLYKLLVQEVPIEF